MFVIFDFDCTITSKHMYYFTYNVEHFLQLYSIPETEKEQYRHMSGVMNKTIKEGIMTFDEDFKDFIIQNIFGGEERIIFLRKILMNLSENNTLIISSRNNVHDIRVGLLLSNLFFNNIQFMFTEIYGYTTSKLEVLNRFIQLGNVTYVDDDDSEHKLFKNLTTNKYKFLSLVKEKGGGIQKEHIEKILCICI